MSAADPRSVMLADLTRCAYRLGLAFGAEAEKAEETARKLEYFELFERCFFAVRVSTALELRLRRPQPAEPRTDREDLSTRAERDPADRDSDADRDRDRDRETERASLPLLLKTLHGVAADAATLPGPEPAALPSLRELLAQMTTAPSAAPVSRRPTAGASAASLRARLTGSAGVATLVRPSDPGGLAARRATGPPPR